MQNMGAMSSKLQEGSEIQPPGQPQAPAAATPVAKECPVGFDKKQDKVAKASPSSLAANTTCPVKNTSSSREKDVVDIGRAGGSDSLSCPVKEGNRTGMVKYLHPHKYNVYSQRVDSRPGTGADDELNPDNNMPTQPNQQPAPGQKRPLSTDRVRSTIPKGGEETTWTYPSPQMFWNALARKGKAEDTEEADMDMVVSIHNNMNERTWKKILEWEKLRNGVLDAQDGTAPRLLRFQGRPDDISPKALIKMMLGSPLPFDRHDWVVDRGGDERRYVIDYYHDEGAPDGDKMPDLHSDTAVKSIKRAEVDNLTQDLTNELVDVRPAVDSFRDLLDRLVKMPLARLSGKSDFTPLPLFPSPTMKTTIPKETNNARQDLANRNEATEGVQQSQQFLEEGSATLPAETPSAAPSSGGLSERDARAVARMAKKCAKPLKALREAEEVGDVARAEAVALRLEFCTARYLCKKEARAYKEALAYADAAGPAHSYWAQSAVEARLLDMRSALERFGERNQPRAAGGAVRREDMSDD